MIILEKNILPLGSVVTLKHGDGTQLMIIARATIVNSGISEVYYDYGAVLIPQGMISPEEVYFFNKENVEEIIFIGFSNEVEHEFEEQYDNLVSNSKFKKGSI